MCADLNRCVDDLPCCVGCRDRTCSVPAAWQGAHGQSVKSQQHWLAGAPVNNHIAAPLHDGMRCLTRLEARVMHLGRTASRTMHQPAHPAHPTSVSLRRSQQAEGAVTRSLQGYPGGAQEPLLQACLSA